MPMRWPAQMVRKVLIARTPRSSGAPDAARGHGPAADRPGRGGASGPCGSGPLPSIGRPSASTTRPSQPRDGRTPATSSRTCAGQPRRTPSRAPNGIASARSPEKPMISHGTHAAAGLDLDPPAEHASPRPARRSRSGARARPRRGRRRSKSGIASTAALRRRQGGFRLSPPSPAPSTFRLRRLVNTGEARV